MPASQPAPPLVSAIIPAYNREGRISRAVESALSQTYERLEVIVVDDGSSDGTLKELAGFGDRIRVISQENGGPSAARNRGAAEANGSYLAFLDSDDVWLPEKTARQVALMECGGVDVCISNCELDDTAGRRTTSFKLAGLEAGPAAGVLRNPAEILASRFVLFNQVVMVRKEVFERSGGFDEKLRLLEDHHLALRLAQHAEWGVIGEVQVVKHEEEDGIGGAGRSEPLKHLRAMERVMDLILEEGAGRQEPGARRILTHARNRVRRAIAACERGKSPAGVARAFGNAQMRALRIEGALWRRGPWWPRPVFGEQSNNQLK